MKSNNIYVLLLILIIGCICISHVSAQDLETINITDDKIDNTLINNDNLAISDDEILADDCCDESETVGETVNSTEDKTWYVEPDLENPNQVQKPTVQPAINQANSGDTIVLNGSFVHCHFVINKTLNVVAAPGTTVGVCPHHNHPSGSDTFGIFYITSEASGTVIDGFGFTNDFFSIANVQQNPFAILIDGASNIELKNLVINWTGVKVNDKNPEDYVFSPIIIKNAVNITLTNIFINNTKVGISIENSSAVKIINSSVVNSKEDGILIGQNSSEISITDNNIQTEKSLRNTSLTVKNLNVKAGDSGNIQINLVDEDNVAIVNKTVSIIINGVTKSVTTDENGNAKLTVKYASAGTNYVVASFLGDDDNRASVSSSKIVVSKKVTTVTAPKKTFKVKATKKIAIALKTGKTVIKNKKITVKVNGKTYSAKTNSKGIATVKIKLTKKGTYKYTAKFAGDSAYKASSKTGKIVVKK